jgi:hypothetical protein
VPGGIGDEKDPPVTVVGNPPPITAAFRGGLKVPVDLQILFNDAWFRKE